MKHEQKHEAKKFQHIEPAHPVAQENPPPIVNRFDVPPPAPPVKQPEYHMTEVTTNGAGTFFLSCRAGCGQMAIVGPEDTQEDRAKLDGLARRSRGQKVQHGPGHV